MAQVVGPFPYDLDHLLGGKWRALVADLSQASPPAVPVKIHDVIELLGTDDYAPKTGWEDLGAGREGASYGRAFTEEGWEIQQADSAVMSDVTGVARSVSVSMAEISSRHLEMIEESPGTEAVAAAVGSSAQVAVPFGEVEELTRYRVALIAMRKKQSGIVTEGAAGPTRGRFSMVVINEATITGDDTGFDLEKGAMSHIPVTFTAFPSAGQPQGKEYGRHVLESSGVIAIA